MITSFGYFKSFREVNPDPCRLVRFQNTSSIEAVVEFTLCEGGNMLIDIAGNSYSDYFCTHPDNNWNLLNPNIVVDDVRDCTSDSDNQGPTAPSPSPSPSPAPAPSPSPAPRPAPLPGDKTGSQ